MAKTPQDPIQSEIASFRCYPEEKERIKKAAKKRKVDLGTFIKNAVMHAVTRVEAR